MTFFALLPPLNFGLYDTRLFSCYRFSNGQGLLCVQERGRKTQDPTGKVKAKRANPKAGFAAIIESPAPQAPLAKQAPEKRVNGRTGRIVGLQPKRI